MSVTAIELRPLPLLLLSLLGVTLSACGAAPLTATGPTLRPDDCLRDLELKDLDGALQRCDQVVAAFPNNPKPLSDRFVLLNLMGQQVTACRDIDQAARMLHLQGSRDSDDVQLRTDIRVRQASCRDNIPPTAGGNR